MQRVLKRRKPFEHAVLVEQLGRIAGDRLELGERPGEPSPQAGDRCCVPLTLPTRDARSHGAILQPKPSSPSRPGWTAQLFIGVASDASALQ